MNRELNPQPFAIIDSKELQEMKGGTMSGGAYLSWVGAGPNAGYCDIDGNGFHLCNIEDQGAFLGQYVYVQQ